METGYVVVNLLGCVLVITSTLVVLSRKLRTADYEIGRASVGKECRSRWSPYH